MQAVTQQERWIVQAPREEPGIAAAPGTAGAPSSASGPAAPTQAASPAKASSGEWLWEQAADAPATPSTQDLPQLTDCQRELADLLSSLGG